MIGGGLHPSLAALTLDLHQGDCASRLLASRCAQTAKRYKNVNQKSKIPEAGSGDHKNRRCITSCRLWALCYRADQLVLHAVANLARCFATTSVNQTTQCVAETILALSHLSLHATRGLLPSV